MGSSTYAEPQPRFLFSDILSALDNLPPTICSVSSIVTRADSDSEVVACLNCDGCRSEELIQKMKTRLGELSRMEKESNQQTRAMLHEKVLGTSFLPQFAVNPRFQELICIVDESSYQLPVDDERPASTSKTEPEDTEPLQKHTLYVVVPKRSGDGDLSVPSDEERECLKCCSALGGGGFRKRMLINWWIGEGLISTSADPDGTTIGLEQAGERMFKNLIEKSFIARPVNPRRESNAPEPTLSELIEYGDSLEGESIYLKSENQIDSTNNDVRRIINVSKPAICSTEAKVIAYMNGLKVLHLGRSNPNKDIKVNGLDSILNRLSKKKQLKLLSLQGITSFRAVPDSICSVTSLMVLDLRTCQALESLPPSIGKLKNLTHLDMSDCYILLSFPKEISSLSKLEVLKGFVISPITSKNKGKTCTIRDLRKLKNLYKLCISISRPNFPERQDLIDLTNIDRLTKLQMIWYSKSKPDDTTDDQPQQTNGNHAPETNNDVFDKLLKLDLRCIPADVEPLLLAPHMFPILEKLCIIGAMFQQLRPDHTNRQVRWNVDTLKLLCSRKLVIRGEDWTRLFTNRVYKKLVVRGCPNVEQPSECSDKEVLEMFAQQRL